MISNNVVLRIGTRRKLSMYGASNCQMFRIPEDSSSCRPLSVIGSRKPTEIVGQEERSPFESVSTS